MGCGVRRHMAKTSRYGNTDAFRCTQYTELAKRNGQDQSLTEDLLQATPSGPPCAAQKNTGTEGWQLSPTPLGDSRPDVL